MTTTKEHKRQKPRWWQRLNGAGAPAKTTNAAANSGPTLTQPGSGEPMVVDGVKIPPNLVVAEFQQKYANAINAHRRDPINYWHGETETFVHEGVVMPQSCEKNKETMLPIVRNYQQNPERTWGMYFTIQQCEELES